jgi:hypothetical protein
MFLFASSVILQWYINYWGLMTYYNIFNCSARNNLEDSGYYMYQLFER